MSSALLWRRAIASDAQLQHVPVSVDTFDATVAAEAVGAGACMVNDVSGGALDPAMFSQVYTVHLGHMQ